MVSVVIPAYNAEKTITQCLQALAEQSYPTESYEVIVVDDGSTDGTAGLVQKHAVKYIHQDNQGPAAARNNGARQSEGDIILFTDADCVPNADWIDQMVSSFNEPDVIAVKGAYKTRQKALVARFAQLEFEERFEMLKRADSIDMVDTYSAGFRRDVFVEMGGFETSFSVANNEDTELSYRMSKLGRKMVFNPAAVVYHLSHPDSVAKYARLKFGRGYWRTVVYKKFPDKMLKDTYTPQTLKLQILFLYLSVVALAATLIWSPLMWPFVFCVGIFVLLTLGFVVKTIRRDPPAAVLSPFFLAVRAASLGAGIIWKIVSDMRPKFFF